MKEKINNFLDQNIYSICFKIIGLGFQVIGILLIIFLKYTPLRAIIGMCFGLVFIALGEIINLLDKIIHKE